jgi:hypothetical protein
MRQPGLWTLACGLAILAAAAGCGQKSEPSAADKKSEPSAVAVRDIDKEIGLSFLPPEGWRKQADAGDAVHIYTGPVKDGFAANLNVRVKGIIPPGPIENGIPLLKKDLAKAFPGSAAAGDGTITVGSRKGIYISTRYTVNNVPLQNIQFFIPGTKNMYTISFTTVESEFATLKPVIDKCIQSVEVE